MTGKSCRGHVFQFGRRVIHGTWKTAGFRADFGRARSGNAFTRCTTIAGKSEGGNRDHHQTNATDDDRCHSAVLSEPRNECGQSDRKAGGCHPLVKRLICQESQAQRGQVGDDKRHRRAVNRTPDGSDHPGPVAPSRPAGWSRLPGRARRQRIQNGDFATHCHTTIKSPSSRNRPHGKEISPRSRLRTTFLDSTAPNHTKRSEIQNRKTITCNTIAQACVLQRLSWGFQWGCRDVPGSPDKAARGGGQRSECPRSESCRISVADSVVWLAANARRTSKDIEQPVRLRGRASFLNVKPY